MSTPTTSSTANSSGRRYVTPHSSETGWTYTSDFLSLSNWETLAYRKSEHDFEVLAKLLTTPSACSKCGRPPEALKPNGTTVQTLVDEPRHCRRMLIYFLRQRYRCACGAYPFQPLPYVAKRRCITERGAEYVARQCLSHSFEFSANAAGISGNTAKNLFADFVVRCESERTIETPEVLGIDGVCVGRYGNKRTYCLLTDISNKTALELLPKCTMLELARFLKQLPKPENLKAVVIDMAKGFLTVILKLYPDAIAVIDPYHVLRMLNDAVTRVVREKQKGLTTAEHKELMRGGNRFLLTTRRSELTKTQKEKLEGWFERVPEFKLAFELKEEAFDIWRIKDRGEAERRYDEWAKKIPPEMRRTFGKFTGAVRRWRTYVFNYFDFKISNAYTESRNRDIKSLQREGRRTSFPVLRARFLFAGITQKPHRIRNRMKPRQLREIARRAEVIQQAVRARDPQSYVERIDAARKAKNEFSRLLYPGEKWLERFGHFSIKSDREIPVKWDFLW